MSLGNCLQPSYWKSISDTKLYGTLLLKYKVSEENSVITKPDTFISQRCDHVNKEGTIKAVYISTPKRHINYRFIYSSCLKYVFYLSMDFHDVRLPHYLFCLPNRPGAVSTPVPIRHSSILNRLRQKKKFCCQKLCS